MKTITVEIFRYDPESDLSPEYAEYVVPILNRVSVLDVLREIYCSQDGTLAFRSCCDVGKCGGCGVRVNGKPTLACQTYVEEGRFLIEPLAGFSVIKDLVVDR